jgi:hypothetical protein
MKNSTPVAVFILFLFLACGVSAQENSTCSLQGVNPPCDEILLEEVISYINHWSHGNASLSNVLRLIFTWADQEETLQEKYLKAIDDAKTAEESEIYRNLTPIIESNTDLFWEDNNGSKKILMVTWTGWDGYVNQTNKTVYLTRETWVTVYPEVKDFVQQNVLPKEKCGLRLEQLNGLPPRNNKKWFVEFYVSPEDLFRPSPDPEINDTQAQLAFPENASTEHMNWINNLKNNSYGSNGYPWTRLGYTYDWAGSSSDHIGLSEYVIRKGAQVKIHDTIATGEYCDAEQRQ